MTIHWFCQKISFISVKYFKICISKSFLLPCFLVCLIGHLQTNWKFFSAKHFIIYFQRSWKVGFISIQNFISTIHWFCQKKIISVKYFKICISKSFMWPRFFLFTLYLYIFCPLLIFFRPLIGPQVTWWDPCLLLVPPPTYKRQRISRTMPIVGPIQFRRCS